MYSTLHNEVAKASSRSPRPRGRELTKADRGHPPPGRVRAGAAVALVALARRLDAERVRRALA